MHSTACSCTPLRTPPTYTARARRFSNTARTHRTAGAHSNRHSHAIVGAFLASCEHMHALHRLVGVRHVLAVVPAFGDGSTARLSGQTRALTISTAGDVTSSYVQAGEEGVHGLPHHRGTGVVTIVFTENHWLATLRLKRVRQGLGHAPVVTEVSLLAPPATIAHALPDAASPSP